MGLQVVVVVEADERSESDWVYIKKTIEQFYDYDRGHLKLSPIYMGGKGNYIKAEKKVRSLVKMYNCKATVAFIEDICSNNVSLDGLNIYLSVLLERKDEIDNMQKMTRIFFLHKVESKCIGGNRMVALRR